MFSRQERTRYTRPQFQQAFIKFTVEYLFYLTLLITTGLSTIGDPSCQNRLRGNEATFSMNEATNDRRLHQEFRTRFSFSRGNRGMLKAATATTNSLNYISQMIFPNDTERYNRIIKINAMLWSSSVKSNRFRLTDWDVLSLNLSRINDKASSMIKFSPEYSKFEWYLVDRAQYEAFAIEAFVNTGWRNKNYI